MYFSNEMRGNLSGKDYGQRWYFYNENEPMIGSWFNMINNEIKFPNRLF